MINSRTSSTSSNVIPVLALVVVLAIIAIPSVQAQTFSVLYNFTPYTGAWPYGTLARDSAGNLYGTTYQGGGSLVGEVFELSPNGAETILHSFSTTGDGYWPFSGVTLTSTGIIYGTAFYGVGTGCSGQGCGMVFKLVNGETILHNFAGGTTDGCNPYGGVTVKNGNLYGTTRLHKLALSVRPFVAFQTFGVEVS